MNSKMPLLKDKIHWRNNFKPHNNKPNLISLSFLIVLTLVSCDRTDNYVTPKNDNDLIRATISEYFQAYLKGDYEKLVVLDSGMFTEVIHKRDEVPKQLQKQVIFNAVQKMVQKIRNWDNKKSSQGFKLYAGGPLYTVTCAGLKYEVMDIRDIRETSFEHPKMAFVKIIYSSTDKAPLEWYSFGVSTRKKVHQAIIKVYLDEWRNMSGEKHYTINHYNLTDLELKYFDHDN